MRLMKVFDCQDMPCDIRNIFFEETEDSNHCNDIYVSWDIDGSWRDDTEDTDNEKLIDNWFFEQGAVREDKEIIVKRWW
jgi:hypothetical protein